MSIAATSQRIFATRLLAIVRSDRPLVISEALVDAGAEVVEFSLTMPSALDAVARQAAATPGVAIGAGTILTVDDARRAVDHGAQFLVSPNLNTDVVAWAGEHDVLHVPGIFTPTEVALALAAGARLLKLFPGAALGPSYVTELLGPFPDLALVPTGGVDESNAAAFLDAGAVALGVAGALAPQPLLDQPDALRAHMRRVIDLVSPQHISLEHSEE